MHELQIKLLELAQTHNLANISLRKLGEMTGAGPKPQVINHHLEQLQKKGFLRINRDKGYMKLVSHESEDELIRIPILGAANCGPALLSASESIEGYLTISKKILGTTSTKGLYALRAVGNSMDNTSLPLLGGGNGSIEEGDYVLVDSEDKSVNDGDIVVSDIDGLANIKRISLHNNVLTLISQSKSHSYHPIFVDPTEMSYYICGKVKKVIKFGFTQKS